jgi:hypothetical protein
MGMYLALSAVSDATIERLHADPPLIWQLVLPEQPDAVAQARAQMAQQPGLLGRLLGQQAAPPPSPAPPPLDLRSDEGDLGEAGDLDKAWHGIHYLLTGTAWEGDPPLNFLLAGGREVDGIDVGYGPARTFSAVETRDIAAALARVSDQELRRRFAPDEMMHLEIYPEIWDRDPEEDDTLGYLMESVSSLRQALEIAVGRGYGLLVTLT